MINDIPHINPLYPGYIYIKTNLIKALPHFDYVEPYISMYIFKWNEMFLNDLLKDYDYAIRHISNKEKNAMYNPKTLVRIKSKQSFYKKYLKDIEPFSKKASPLNDTAKIIISNNTIIYSDYDKENNILRVSKTEEDYINEILLNKIKGNFKILKDEISIFYDTYKESEFVFSLKECLSFLSKIDKDIKYLDNHYKREPNLESNNLDLNGYRDTLFIEWKSLLEHIENLHFDIYDHIKLNKYKPEREYPKIFKDYISFKHFTELYQYLDVLPDAKKNQVKLSAIWEHGDGRKLLNTFVSKKEYVQFLNKHFKTSYKSRSMSKGSNYHHQIDEFFKNHS